MASCTFPAPAAAPFPSAKACWVPVELRHTGLLDFSWTDVEDHFLPLAWHCFRTPERGQGQAGPTGRHHVQILCVPRGEAERAAVFATFQENQAGSQKMGSFPCFEQSDVFLCWSCLQDAGNPLWVTLVHLAADLGCCSHLRFLPIRLATSSGSMGDTRSCPPGTLRVGLKTGCRCRFLSFFAQVSCLRKSKSSRSFTPSEGDKSRQNMCKPLFPLANSA